MGFIVVAVVAVALVAWFARPMLTMSWRERLGFVGLLAAVLAIATAVDHIPPVRRAFDAIEF